MTRCYGLESSDTYADVMREAILCLHFTHFAEDDEN
jgi:hypothetical protein